MGCSLTWRTHLCGIASILEEFCYLKVVKKYTDKTYCFWILAAHSLQIALVDDCVIDAVSGGTNRLINRRTSLIAAATGSIVSNGPCCGESNNYNMVC